MLFTSEIYSHIQIMSLNVLIFFLFLGTDLSSTYSGLKEIEINQCVQLKKSDKWEESKCDAFADVNLCEFTPGICSAEEKNFFFCSLQILILHASVIYYI